VTPRWLARCADHGIFFGMLLVVAAISAAGQTETATLSGSISDQGGAVIQNATVYLSNAETGVTINTTSNASGLYVFPSVRPGRYQVMVEKEGFKHETLTDLTLNVQDTLRRNFRLLVGSSSETVTVNGDMISLNTETGTVSTVVDHQFVENIPLNGRTFQTLIELTPGVVATTGSNFNGTLSVNGQRQDANNFTVDGVSANVGFTPSPGSAFTIGGAGASGNLPNLTALGTTQSLVSVDAMQEFRVQTSTYSAEYGRQPGGQVSIVTRSGTNAYHGTLFDYLRNTVFDANNWFANHTGAPRPPEIQNDFGGVFGGPVRIPHLYNGKDRTFFFFSYEGLRLRQPSFALTNVPTPALRAAAVPSLRPILNDFPLPNCPAGSAPAVCSNDLGNGLGDFSASFSNAASLNATSLRIDHMINDKWTVFARYNYSLSTVIAPQAFDLAITSKDYATTKTATLGLTGMLSPRLINELRVNFSSSPAYQTFVPGSTIGGAIPAPISALVPSQYPAASTQAALGMTFPGATTTNGVAWDIVGGNLTENANLWNIVDTVSYRLGSHQLKFGVDWRRVTPVQSENQYLVQPSFTNQSQLINGIVPTLGLRAQGNPQPVYINLSLFAQDDWQVSRRLSLDLGLRWDVNPAPGSRNGAIPPAVNQISNFATMALAPPGTPDWGTTYTDFGPRVGAAYQISQKSDHELVLRGGFGVFYDTGNNLGSAAYNSYPFNITTSIPNVAFPLNPIQIAPPVIPPLSNLTPPYGTLFLFDPHLTLPYTLQYSVALEQAFGSSQTVSVAYVGNRGENLLQNQQYSIGAINHNFATVEITSNESTSSYDSLQAQFRRRLSRGLQALLSYTWSHAIDTASTDAASVFPPIRGNSAYDVPQVFAGAFTYNIPTASSNRVAEAVLGKWSVSSNIHVQSGLPLNITAVQAVNPVTGGTNITFPNVITGVPFYLYGSQFPGGRIINNTPPTPAQVAGAGCAPVTPTTPAKGALCTPAAGQNGDIGRDVFRATPNWQVDMALQREFGLTDKLKLEFRGEAFNVFNHPNFGLPNATLTAANFGQPTTMLNGALVGVNPLYQIGGPRSMQFSLKLKF
jgi:hypothetical protein